MILSIQKNHNFSYKTGVRIAFIGCQFGVKGLIFPAISRDVKKFESLLLRQIKTAILMQKDCGFYFFMVQLVLITMKGR